LNKVNKGLFFSVIFHLILFAIFSQQFSKSPLHTEKKNKPVKQIQARLYFPTVKEQSSASPKIGPPEIEESPPKIEKIKNTQTTKKTAQIPTKATEVAEVVVNVQPKVLPKQTITNNVLTSETSSKSITQASLERLRQRLNTQTLESSQDDSFEHYLDEKSTIAPSITQFNQLPKAGAKVREVDCNASGLNSAVTAISGLLGGSVRCNSMPNLKPFLEKRLKQRGK
jgi:hypothetical protein